jgi:hypothetical protein
LGFVVPSIINEELFPLILPIYFLNNSSYLFAP